MSNHDDINDAFNRRRWEENRKDNSTSQHFIVRGDIEVYGTGEAIITVIFPVYFIDKPHFTTGHELGSGQPAVAGNLPVISTTVIKWATNIRDDGTVVYYGASLAVVSSGPTGQALIIQWHAQGVGLRGPIPDQEA